MGRPNLKWNFLLEQPAVQRFITLIDFAWVLYKSPAKRAFFIETLFEPKRPTDFKSKKFSEIYGFSLQTSNIQYYAEALNQKFAATFMFQVGGSKPLFEKETKKHKTVFWINKFGKGSLAQNTQKIIYKLQNEPHLTKNLKPAFNCDFSKCNDLKYLKQFLNKNCFGSIDSAVFFVMQFCSKE